MVLLLQTLLIQTIGVLFQSWRGAANERTSSVLIEKFEDSEHLAPQTASKILAHQAK
jgi:hypothetical protein